MIHYIVLHEANIFNFQSISIFLSLIALILSWYYYSHFLKQRQSVKQLEIVNELIFYICNQKIEFLFGYSNGNMYSGSSIQKSIFEIKNLEFDDKYFMNSPILLNLETNGIIDISKYLNTPMIPVAIREELENFQSSVGRAVYISDIVEDNKGNTEKSAIVISSNANEKFTLFNSSSLEKHVYVEYDAFACNDWGNFKCCSFNLVKAIEDWFKKNNINNIKLN